MIIKENKCKIYGIKPSLYPKYDEKKYLGCYLKKIIASFWNLTKR